MLATVTKGARVVRQLQGLRGVGLEHWVLPTRRVMQPWIIEELWRREEDEKRRRDEYERRQEIHIDAPVGPMPEEPALEPEELPKRGVLIIEL